MAITLQQFVSQLNESGVISAEELSTFQESQSPPIESAEDLGKLLVKHKKVTKLQAQMVYQGKGERLLLGNYIVLDKIGAGGMGDVYLAEHRRMKRQVALKTLPTAMTKDSQAIGRFHREVQAAAKLSHPNIVAAYDADEANGVHYFVMEHVDGIDLSAVVKKQGVLKVDVAVDYILQAAKGLEFAHNKGVIHRDIKPANMLLDKEGTVKILDMGLARIEDEAHEIPATQLTQDGSVMGTVDYMAPEQAKDTHSADARSDIYSLGCSLYYLLTGESVYRGSTMVNRIMAHQNEPIPSLASSHVNIPADIDAVYQKMIAKRPEDRFQSMQEVIVAIENCIRMKSSQTVSEEQSDPELHKFLQSQRMASSPTVVMSADAIAAEKSQADSLNQTPTSDFLNKTLGGTSYRPLAKRKQFIGKRGGIIAGVVLASLVLIAGIIFKTDTPAGTIILEIDQPELAGAVVSVDDQQKITIKTGEGKEPIEVVADEKTHTLKVSKGGFETFTKQFTVKAGGKESIKVRLVRSNMGIDNELKMNGEIDREIAKWAIGLGGAVRIGDKDYTNIKQLPTLPFVVSDLKIEGTSVKDDDLKRLAKLKALTLLNLNSTSISDTGLQHLKKMQDLRALFLNKTKITDEGLQHLRPHQKLENLMLSATKISGEGLDYLKDLPKLRTINVNGSAITNSGMKAIGNLRQLESVNIAGNSQIDDTGLAYLEGLTKLEELYAYSVPQITDKGFKDLQGLNNLKYLHLGSTGMTDDGLEQLAGLKNLSRLDVTNCKVTSSGLEHLKDLKNLKELQMRLTSVSDLGLQHLHGLKTLEKIELQQTKVTPQGVAELQKALPSCKIASDFETNPTASEKGHYALRFQNRSDHVALPLKHETAGDFTVEAWVSIDENSIRPQNYITNAFEKRGLFLGITSLSGTEKQWSTIIANNGQFQHLPSKSKVKFGERTNIAVTYKGNVAQIYVNGHKKGEMNFKGSEIHTENSFSIGWTSDVNFKGSIDEVRFSNIARYTEDFTPTDHFENDKNTLALYHFDEGKGDVLKDSSGNGHDGKIVGAKWVKVDDELQGSMVPLAVAEAVPPAKSHYALRFQNSSDLVTLPLKHETAGDLTVEAWVTIDENSNRPQHFITNGNSKNGFFLDTMKLKEKETQWSSTIRNNDQYPKLQSKSKVEFGKRTNIAITFKGNVAQIYVDGHKKGEMNFKGLKIHTDRPFSIGWVTSQNFKGSIDEVRFSNTARYSQDFTPKDHFDNDKNTLALYHFDEGSGDILKDSSGNGHDGKIVGAKWVKLDDDLQGSMVPLKVAEKKVPPAGTPAKSHYALRFQNSSDLVTLPLKHETAGDLTVEAWVTIDEHSTRPLQFISNGSHRSSFSIGFFNANENKPQWHTTISNNGKYQVLPSNSKVELGKRTNIAVTYKGDVVQIYVNGHKQGEMNFKGSEIHSDQFITIGTRFKTLLPIKGSIDEVRISNIVRYTKDFTPTDHFDNDKNTMALYHFDEGSGDVLKDSSGNGHDGKIVGAKWVKVDDELQVVKPAKAGDTPMTDREIAEWVIGMGGWVNTGGKSVTKIEQLPTEPFIINFLDLKGTSVKDEDLKRLAGLKTLPKLNLENTLVSDTGLQYLKDIPLNYISLIGTQITDKGFGYLSNMPSLTTLYVGSTAISNSGVEQLKDMKQLNQLSLSYTQIDDIGLGHLAGLINLKTLDIHATPVTDSGLKHLKGMKQLQHIVLARTRITNAGLKELADLKDLKKLRFDSTAVSDTGLEQLAGFKNLSFLAVANCKVTNSGLEHLKDLKNLKELQLRLTSVSDAGLKHLHSLKKLEDLDLQQTTVTPQGIADLQKALPNCKIESDFETKPPATKAP